MFTAYSTQGQLKPRLILAEGFWDGLIQAAAYLGRESVRINALKRCPRLAEAVNDCCACIFSSRWQEHIKWTFNNQNSIYSMQFCSIFGAVLREFLSCGIVVLLNQAGIYKFSGTAISMRFEVFLCYSVRFCGIVEPLYVPLRGSRLGPGRPCSHNSGTTSYFSGKPDTDLIIF